MIEDSAPSKSSTIISVLPALAKTAIVLLIGAGLVSYLTRLKSEQIALHNYTTPRLKWVHGTSDFRLQDAISKNDSKAVSTLLPHVPKDKIRPGIVDILSFDRTANALDAFLSFGWNANGIRHNGQPLMNAVQFSQPKALAALLDHGADPDAKDEIGRSATLWASISLRYAPEMLKLLASHHAKIDAISSFTSRQRFPVPVVRQVRFRPISVAAQRENLSAVATLLDLGARIDPGPDEDSSPLAGAIMGQENEQVVSLLLDRGADPNAPAQVYLDPKAPTRHMLATPLYIACVRKRLDAVRLLLLHHADPTRKSSDGKTALDVATGPLRDLMLTAERPRP